MCTELRNLGPKVWRRVDANCLRVTGSAGAGRQRRKSGQSILRRNDGRRRDLLRTFSPRDTT